MNSHPPDELVPVILSGGTGSRLWPLSRRHQPKQLLALVDERTMLRSTFDRLEGLDAADPVVVCNVSHHYLVESELRKAGRDPSRIILEPVGRNTAPAVAAAAWFSMRKETDPTLLVLPADHLITDEDAFTAAVMNATSQAREGWLVTFGIVPTYPETGYGYIRSGASVGPHAREITEFVEKPNLDTAKGYLESGEYLWNSGMFVFKASRYLTELEELSSQIYEAAITAMRGARDQGAVHLESGSFAASPSDSIDFAVMEHTSKGAVVPLDAGWSDVGSWSAIWELTEPDDHGNVIRGDVQAIDVKGSYLRSESRLLAAVGLEDTIVVETPDAILIAPRDRAQDIKALVDELDDADRTEARSPSRERRPWGDFEVLDRAAGFQVKRLTVAPGGRLSLQRHRSRAEYWVVATGIGELRVGDEVKQVSPGDTVHIPPGAQHRVANPGADPLVIVEVQLGNELLESDIERLEDDYGRS